MALGSTGGPLGRIKQRVYHVFSKVLTRVTECDRAWSITSSSQTSVLEKRATCVQQVREETRNVRANQQGVGQVGVEAGGRLKQQSHHPQLRSQFDSSNNYFFYYHEGFTIVKNFKIHFVIGTDYYSTADYIDTAYSILEKEHCLLPLAW